MVNPVKYMLAASFCMLALSCSPDVVPGTVSGEGYANGGAGDTSGSGNGGSNWNGSGEDNNGNWNGNSEDNSDNDNNQKESMTINIRIADKVFRADIEDSKTGRAFVSKLPLTLDMNELNGNEKYCYGVSLPRADRRYDVIDAGDIMLYSGNCIVLFYGQAGGYTYTRIGRLQSVAGLAAALGGGPMSVTFEQ